MEEGERVPRKLRSAPGGRGVRGRVSNGRDMIMKCYGMVGVGEAPSFRCYDVPGGLRKMRSAPSGCGVRGRGSNVREKSVKCYGIDGGGTVVAHSCDVRVARLVVFLEGAI